MMGIIEFFRNLIATYCTGTFGYILLMLLFIFGFAAIITIAIKFVICLITLVLHSLFD
jgi:hypothetical protein